MKKENEEKLPSSNALFQQELKSLTPNCNLKCSIICNSILLILFLAAGVPILLDANKIKEITINYTNW